MLVTLLVAVLCVPQVQMPKTVFLECVKPYPDEYWVARQHGVPSRIVDKSSPQLTQIEWIYAKVNGHEDIYTFGANGRLRSAPKAKPSPQPSTRKLISPTR